MPHSGDFFTCKNKVQRQQGVGYEYYNLQAGPGPKAHATAKEETSRAPPILIDDRYQLFAKRLTKIGCEILLLLDDTFVDHIN